MHMLPKKKFNFWAAIVFKFITENQSKNRIEYTLTHKNRQKNVVDYRMSGELIQGKMLRDERYPLPSQCYWVGNSLILTRFEI